MIKIFYVYILKCADDSLYTGYTNDLVKRVDNHNKGKASKYTRAKLPVSLIYYEEYLTKSESMKREIEVKRLSRDEKLTIIDRQIQTINR